jgi:N-acyl-D-amino-acid deacylase
MFDIIIKNGTIIDGTGQQMFHADIGIRQDKIVKIGDLYGEKADMELDALGKFICPGFIDVNNHSDTYWQLFINSDLSSLIYQGVTTIIGGNCGSSLAPLVSAKDIETIQKWADIKTVNVDWLKLSEFFEVLEEKKLPVNFGTLSGHGTMRRGILKDMTRNLTSRELEMITQMLSQAMDDGSLGMSTGLVYTHARVASLEELVHLAKAVSGYGGIYATHMRGEGEDLLTSMEEAIRIAQDSGVKLHISHLKAMGEKNWPKMKDALSIMDHADSIGIDVTFDVYPYTNTGSVLYTLLPAWVSEGGKRMLIHRLKDPAIRSKVVEEMKDSDFDYSKVEIAISPMDRTLTRRKIIDIARSQGKSVEDAVIDLLIACDGRIITSMEILSEENIEMAIRHPLSIIATNGAGYNLNHKLTGEIAHPRSFGTFIKVLVEYVKEKELLRWEEAVRKMTGLPAEKFGIFGRGKLLENYYADITIIDPDRIESPSTKEDPYQYARGVDFVFVNGKLILSAGQYTADRAGIIIKR